MKDEDIIKLLEENEKLKIALTDLIYICETSDKMIDCLSEEFIRIKMISERLPQNKRGLN